MWLMQYAVMFTEPTDDIQIYGEIIEAGIVQNTQRQPLLFCVYGKKYNV